MHCDLIIRDAVILDGTGGQGVTTVVVGNCGISLSPVRMATRPMPPLDLLGDESW